MTIEDIPSAVSLDEKCSTVSNIKAIESTASIQDRYFSDPPNEKIHNDEFLEEKLSMGPRSSDADVLQMKPMENYQNKDSDLYPKLEAVGDGLVERAMGAAAFSDNTSVENTEDQRGEEDKEQEDENPQEEPKKCLACRQCCLACCRPCMIKYNPLSWDATRGQRFHHALMCPPHGKLARLGTLVLSVIGFWAVLWSITGEHALPGGNFFGVLVLLVLSVVGGQLVGLIHLPPLLGMLVVGCLLRNVPVVNVAKDINPAWSSAFRSIALVVILTRAGLGLDPVALRRLSVGVIRLAFLPCILEAVTAAVTSHLLLGFPWDWGFMLGFVLAAVSPAVVVPCMLHLNEKGYGVDKGIPTLVIAAASVDDVLAISGFGVVLGIAFSSGNLVLTIFKGPLEALLGVVYGIVLGILCWYVPHKKHSNRTLFQFILLFCGGLFAQFGSRVADLSGAGALGCLSMAFVAGLRWRRDVPGGGDPKVSIIFAYLWVIFQPLLFGLIGAEIDVTKIQLKTIGMGVAVLAIGLVIRMVASFLAVFRLGLNMREKLFIPLAWLPKATVQAAIGSIALDTAREKNAPADQIELGIQLLTIAVLVILITAPLGAIAITLSAPRLLTKTGEPSKRPPVEDQRTELDPENANYGKVSVL